MVVEELDPFIDNELRARFRVTGRDLLPRCGELSAPRLRSALSSTTHHEEPAPEAGLPPRPPVPCPGCPHRGVLYLLRRLKVTVTGHIGCYTLGVNPPLSAIHTCALSRPTSRCCVGAVDPRSVVPPDSRLQLPPPPAKRPLPLRCWYGSVHPSLTKKHPFCRLWLDWHAHSPPPTPRDGGRHRDAPRNSHTPPQSTAEPSSGRSGTLSATHRIPSLLLSSPGSCRARPHPPPRRSSG